jgi:hypothetical protein
MAGDIKAGGAYVELSAHDELLREGFDRAAARLDSFGQGAQRIGIGIAAAGGVVVAGLGAMVNGFAAAGDQLDEMSVKTGVSVEKLSALKYAASFSSIGLDQLGGALAKMQKSIVAGNPAIAKLGVDLDALKAQSPDEQLGTLADAINAIEDPAQRSSAAMGVFGKAGVGLLPFLAEGSQGIARLTKEAGDLGLVMSGQSATAAAKFDDAMTKLKTGAGALSNQIGAALAPVLTEVVNRILPLIPAAAAWIEQNQGLVITVAVLAGGLVLLGTSLVVLGTLFSSIATVVGVAGTVLAAWPVIVGALGAAIAVVFSPIGLLIAGIATLGALFLTATEPGRALVSWLGGAFTTAFQGAWSVVLKFVDIVKGALGTLWEYIRPVLEGLGLLSNQELPSAAPAAATGSPPAAATPAGAATPAAVTPPAIDPKSQQLIDQLNANAAGAAGGAATAGKGASPIGGSPLGGADVARILGEIKQVGVEILAEMRSGGSAGGLAFE